MCRVRCEISEGLVASECVAKISTLDGRTEEVAVSTAMIDRESSAVHAWAIDIQDERALIELPRETASGKWRLWVNKSDLRDLSGS